MKIEIQNATKSFGSFRALHDVSMTIESGQIVTLLGCNGAGKTTVLRCLAGVASLDRGEILFGSEKFHRERTDLRRRLFFLPDFPPVFAAMTPIRHIGMVARLYGAPVEGMAERVVDLLEDFHMLALAEVPMMHLSRGQLYKAALVALLAVDPELWLLDEPFASGMDPAGIGAFKDRARDAVKRGRTVIYSTQILEIAERFSDRACVIERGEVRAFDRLDQMPSGDGESPLEKIFRALRGDRK